MQADSTLRASMSGCACETTTICVSLAAAMISLASAGKRSGCRLVSGWLSTMSSGGRGVRRAAVQEGA